MPTRRSQSTSRWSSPRRSSPLQQSRSSSGTSRPKDRLTLSTRPRTRCRPHRVCRWRAAWRAGRSRRQAQRADSRRLRSREAEVRVTTLRTGRAEGTGSIPTSPTAWRRCASRDATTAATRCGDRSRSFVARVRPRFSARKVLLEANLLLPSQPAASTATRGVLLTSIEPAWPLRQLAAAITTLRSTISSLVSFCVGSGSSCA